MWGEGKRGAGREEKRMKTLAPAHRNQAVFCDTLKKRRWSPPHKKSCNRATGADTLSRLLPAQLSVSLHQRSENLPLFRQ